MSQRTKGRSVRLVATGGKALVSSFIDTSCPYRIIASGCPTMSVNANN